MLFVDGMNGMIIHNEVIQWLYSLLSSQVSSPMANFNLVYILTIIWMIT